MPSDRGISTSVIAITGPIASDGEGAPSHDTTALIASNPGRGRTNSVASRGIGISGSTLCDLAIAVASPACVGESQSGGRSWPCRAQTKMAAPTAPASSAGIGSHHGAASGAPTSLVRQRMTAATPSTTRTGRIVSGSNGMCTSCIARPATPMNPAERPGAIARRCHARHPGASSVARANPGSRAAITTPGSDCARSCSGKPGGLSGP